MFACRRGLGQVADTLEELSGASRTHVAVPSFEFRHVRGTAHAASRARLLLLWEIARRLRTGANGDLRFDLDTRRGFAPCSKARHLVSNVHGICIQTRGRLNRTK